MSFKFVFKGVEYDSADPKVGEMVKNNPEAGKEFKRQFLNAYHSLSKKGKGTLLGKVGRDDALGMGQGMAKAWCMEALKYVHQDIVGSGLTEEDYLAKSSIK